jgi:hypothetical protein
MAITAEQIEIAERLVESIKNMTQADYDQIRENIRKENEYMAKKEAAQKPTREQMQLEYTI